MRDGLLEQVSLRLKFLDLEFECYLLTSPADLFGIKLANIHHRGGSASIYFNRSIFRDIPAEAYV